MFRRRNYDILDRMRDLIWPRTSFRRSSLYLIKRILRLSTTPHAVSAGVAVGVFASFSPFLGFHLVIALILALPLYGNLLIASLSTLCGNPVTFPAIWTANYFVGSFIINGTTEDVASGSELWQLISTSLVSDFSWENLTNVIKFVGGEIGWPMLIGSIPNGLIVSITLYLITYYFVSTYRNSRESKLAERRHHLNDKLSGTDSFENTQ